MKLFLETHRFHWMRAQDTDVTLPHKAADKYGVFVDVDLAFILSHNKAQYADTELHVA